MVDSVKCKMQRESNIELLRIIVMLFILMHHLIVHALCPSVLSGKVELSAEYATYSIMEGFFYVGVNVFLLISGYFGIRLRARRIWSLYLQLAFYCIIAYLFGFFSFILIPDSINIILKLFIADVVATIVVWVFGIFLRTASIYDPYWSIQTPVIYVALLIHYGNYNVGNIIFLILILLWAIRLTINFIITFNDITYIDWRYSDIKNKTNKLYQIVNLIGIHMMPTILVFLASVPAFLYVINGYDFTPLSIIGYVLIILAVFFELISDINIHVYKKNRKSRSEIINVGFWKYSRHPNYFGEITFYPWSGYVRFHPDDFDFVLGKYFTEY